MPIIRFLECDHGTFGDGCQLKCHCANNSPCNHIDGKCRYGVCAAGYKGDNCQEGKVFLFFRIKIMLLSEYHKNNHINGTCQSGWFAAG